MARKKQCYGGVPSLHHWTYDVWVLLAIDDEEHFDRGSVARWPWRELVNTAIWQLHLIYCVVFFIFVFLLCRSLSYFSSAVRLPCVIIYRAFSSIFYFYSLFRYVTCVTSRTLLVITQMFHTPRCWWTPKVEDHPRRLSAACELGN